MKRLSALIGLMLLLFVMSYAAQPNPVVGAWDCKSVDERGTELTWTLNINEKLGKLAGWVQIGEDRVDLIDPKLDGQTFTFSVAMNPEETVAITLKLDGNKLAGTFSGKTSGNGTITGQKQQA